MTSIANYRAPEASQGSAPVGHRGPRGSILLHLKRTGQATAGELGQALGCSLNAVRHHLKELEVEGVVVFDREQRAVGAPAHAFRLTPQGHALFPDRYERAVADLLDHVVKSEGRDAAVRFLENQYRALAVRLEVETRDVPPAMRGEVIARALDAEGYMATWAEAAEGGLLTEHNCPHRLIAERFPEVCAAEERFLAQVFGVPVERRSRIAGGCGTCSYRVATGGAAVEEEG
ncbi:MAG: helix-turn-helix domain-containing protein [Gemmatimonadota bacterium]